MSKAEIGAGQSANPFIDSATGGLIILDVPHQKIHNGNHYYIAGYETVGSDGTLNFTVTANADDFVHLTFHISGTNVTTVDVYEGASGISGGTALTPINNNRNSSNTSGLTAKVNPTVTPGSNTIDGYKFGSNGGGNAPDIGGGVAREDEIILKRSTSYLWQIVSGAADNLISYRIDWYE